MSVILHHAGAYNLYSTVADGPIFVSALTEEQLIEAIQQEEGNIGIRNLPPRLDRAKRNGTSSVIHSSLENQLALNRAGPKETHIPFDEFIKRYLTL